MNKRRGLLLLLLSANAVLLFIFSHSPTSIVFSIFSPNPVLECNTAWWQDGRYDRLEGEKVMMVASLRDCEKVLATMKQSIAQVVSVLGSHNVVLSIFESGSRDRTPQILTEWGDYFNSMGLAQVHIRTHGQVPNFKDHNRIEVLADIRNQPMAPLASSLAPPPRHIIFLNDVYVCASSILELLYQHVVQGADLTCPFDWWKRDVFYDVWVARDLKGDLFYPMSEDGPSYKKPTVLFAHNADAQKKYLSGESFQVYSCWNGMAVINSAPFVNNQTRFRRSRKDECAVSEAQLLAKDFWTLGYRKIMVVPTVNVAYTIDVARYAEKRNNETQKWNGLVNWTATPPEKVRCHPWPERNGLDHWVWSQTLWVDPV